MIVRSPRDKHVFDVGYGSFASILRSRIFATTLMVLTCLNQRHAVVGMPRPTIPRTAAYGASRPLRPLPAIVSFLNPQMVYRGGAARIDDECASPFFDDSGLRSGDLDPQEGAIRWSISLVWTYR